MTTGRTAALAVVLAVGLSACSSGKAKPAATTQPTGLGAAATSTTLPPGGTSTPTGGTATAKGGTTAAAISRSDAIGRASDALKAAGASLDGSAPTVSLSGNSYTVTYPPASDQLGGRYQATVNATTGAVTDVQIDR